MPEPNAYCPEEWQPRIPAALDVAAYALPEDRRALQRLRTLAPLVYATRMYLKHVGEPMARAQLLGGAVRVTERQFSHLYRIVTECARVLHMEPPEVFVIQHPVMNAHTYGHQKPVVVLNSGLVDAMTEAELAFTLGHEFGHIKSEHVLFLNLADFLRSRASDVLQWVAAPAALAIYAWQRYAEHTADRAGLIACQRPGASQAALIKLALGSQQLFEQLDVEEYLGQNLQLDTLPARAVLALQGHPYTARRVVALRTYAASPAFAALWSARASGAPTPSAPSAAQRVGATVGHAATKCAHYSQNVADLVRARVQSSLRGVPIVEGFAGGGEQPTVSAQLDEEPV